MQILPKFIRIRILLRILLRIYQAQWGAAPTWPRPAALFGSGLSDLSSKYLKQTAMSVIKHLNVIEIALLCSKGDWGCLTTFVFVSGQWDQRTSYLLHANIDFFSNRSLHFKKPWINKKCITKWSLWSTMIFQPFQMRLQDMFMFSRNLPYNLMFINKWAILVLFDISWHEETVKILCFRLHWGSTKLWACIHGVPPN